MRTEGVRIHEARPLSQGAPRIPAWNMQTPFRCKEPGNEPGEAWSLPALEQARSMHRGSAVIPESDGIINLEET